MTQILISLLLNLAQASIWPDMHGGRPGDSMYPGGFPGAMGFWKGLTFDFFL